jgi:hypothetical protein
MIYHEGFNPNKYECRIFGLDDLIGGAIGAGTSLVSGIMQRNAAEDAAKQGNQIISSSANQAQGYLAPYENGGQTGLNAEQKMVSNPSSFNMANFYSDPGYQFQLQQGNQAIQRSAAARGGLMSGGTAKGIAQYTTGLANQTYGDAYSRYLQTNQQNFNQASTLAGQGLNASGQSASNTLGAGTAQANNLTSAITGGAAASASGYVGVANAVNGSLSNYYLQNAVNNGGGYSGGGYGTVPSTNNLALYNGLAN